MQSCFIVEIGPDPTQAYFWPAVYKGLKPILSRVLFAPTWWDFLDLKWKKLKKLRFLGEIIQAQTKDDWSVPTRAKKFFWPGPVTRVTCYLWVFKTYSSPPQVSEVILFDMVDFCHRQPCACVGEHQGKNVVPLSVCHLKFLPQF